MSITAEGRLTLPALPRTIRLLRNDESIALDRRVPSAAGYDASTRCITCKGGKIFRWWHEEQVRIFSCPCEEQYMLFRWLMHCGVPINYQRLGWTDLIELSPSTTDALGEYGQYRSGYIDAGIGVILNGPKGNGKTLLAMLLLKQMIAEGVDIYATTFADMIEAFADGWHERAQSQWFNATVRNAGVLYIDDLGRERNKGPNSVGENMLETVVRARVANNQPTLITTNLDTDDIHKGYGGHTMSLLTERSLIIPVHGRDRRDEIRRRAQDEVKMGLTRPLVLA